MNRPQSGQPASRKNWRQSSYHRPPGAAPPRGLRWFATFTVLALIGLLLYLILPKFWEKPLRTQIVAITAGATNHMSVPSLLFGAHDVEPLSRIAAQATPDRCELLEWPQLMEGGQLPGLPAELGRLPQLPDVRLLYFAAHGVARGGQPQLLERDFTLQNASGPIPWTGKAVDFAALLQQLPWPADGAQLVIVDACHLVTDSRLGLLVNGFPYDVQQLVARLPAKRQAYIWLAAAPGELAQVDSLRGTSLFAATLFAGLAGAADQAPWGNADRLIELHELAQYVQSTVQTQSGDTQHPLLLSAGTSQPLDVNQLPPLRLMKLDQKWLAQATPAASDASPAANSPSTPANPAANPPTPPATSPSTAPQSPAPGTTPTAATTDELLEPARTSRRWPVRFTQAATGSAGGVSSPASTGQSPEGVAPSGGPASAPAAGTSSPAAGSAALPAGSGTPAAGSGPAATGGPTASPTDATGGNGQPTSSGAGNASGTAAGGPPASTAPAAAAPGANGGGPVNGAASPTNPAAAGAAPAPDPAAAAATAAKALSQPLPTTARALLDMAWELRDRLETRDAAAPWSIVDISYPWWLELNRWLVEYEYQVGAVSGVGAADSAQPGLGQRVVADLTEIVRGLQWLEAARVARQVPAGTPGAGLLPSVPNLTSQSILQRLVNHVRQLTAQDLWFGPNSVPAGLEAWAQAKRTWWHASYRASQALAWYAESIAIRAESQNYGDALLRLLERLDALAGLLEAAESRGLERSDAAAVSRAAAEVSRELATLDQLYNQHLAVGQQAPANSAAARLLERALLSPLPRSTQRREIQQLLSTRAALAAGPSVSANAPQPAPSGAGANGGGTSNTLSPPSAVSAGGVTAGGTAASVAGPTNTSGRRRTYAESWPLNADYWQRIGHLLSCHAAWAKLAGNANSTQLDTAAAELRRLAIQGNDGAIWNHVDQAGGMLAVAAELPHRSLRSVVAPALRERYVLTLDPRDANAFASFSFPIVPQLRWTLPAALQLNVPDQIALNLLDWVPFRVSYSLERSNSNQLQLKLQYDKNLLEIRTISAAGNIPEPLPSNGTLLRKLDGASGDRAGNRPTGSTAGRAGSVAESIQFQVRPRSNLFLRSGQQPLPLTITAEANSQRKEAALSVYPYPFVLQAARLHDNQRLPTGNLARNQGIRLAPFSRRPTTFELQLTQWLPDQQEVDVVIYQIPRPASATWRPGFLVDLDGRPLPGLDAVTTAILSGQDLGRYPIVARSKAPLKFARSGESQLVSLGPATPPAPAPPPAAANPAAATPPVPAADKPLVTHGLLCRIQSKQNPDRNWWQWMEVAPLHPSEYVEVVDLGRTVYQPQSGMFQIQLQLKPNAGVPGLSDKLPVVLRWLTDGAVDLNQGVKELGEIKRESDVVTLQGILLPDDKPLVQISVDDYPRALAFELNRTGAVTDVSQARHRARISAVRMFHTPPTPLPALYLAQQGQSLPSWEADPKAVDIRDLSLVGMAAFPVPAGISRAELRTEVQVDTPATAFSPVAGQNAAIQVVLDPSFSTTPTTVYADRDWDIVFHPPTEAGELVLEANVRDFQISTQATGMRRLRGPLTVVNQGSAGAAAEDRVEIVIDEQRPNLRRFELAGPTRVTKGTALRVVLAGNDLSLIQSATVGLVPANEEIAQWKPETGKAVNITQSSTNREAFSGEAVLATSQLMAGDYQIAGQLVDLAGNVFLVGRDGLAPIQLHIDEPVVPKAGEPKPGVDPDFKGPIAGKAFVGSGKGLEDVEVELKGGKPIPPQKTGNGGSFRFENVPLGEYTLEAKGKLNNRADVTGSRKILLEKPADYSPPYDVKLEAGK